MRTQILIGVAIAALLGLSGTALAEQNLKRPFAGISTAEVPAKAVEMIQAVTEKDREVATARITGEAVTAKPAASAAIVGAIAKALPEMAPTAAAAAAQKYPKLALEIARAAAAAAPTKAGAIAVAMCRVTGAGYKDVVKTIAKAAPESSREILMMLAGAFPELKTGIEAALAGYGTKQPSVAAVMDTTAPVELSSTEAVRGPTLAPPFIPGSITGSAVTPDTSGVVPAGGRDYAKP